MASVVPFVDIISTLFVIGNITMALRAWAVKCVFQSEFFKEHMFKGALKHFLKTEKYSRMCVMAFNKYVAE